MNRSELANMKARAQKKERIGKVLEWLVANKPYGEICTEGAEEWNCTVRAVGKYIQEVRQKIIPTWYQFTEQRILAAEQIAKTENICRRALAKGEHQTALNCLKWIGELQGLTVSQQMAKAQLGEAGEATSMDFDGFNRARAIYGLPPWSKEKWELFHSGGDGEQAN